MEGNEANDPDPDLAGAPVTSVAVAPVRVARSSARLGPGAQRLAWMLRRIGAYLVTAFFAVTLNFLIPRFMPGDPAADLLVRIQVTTGQPPTPEQVEAVRRFFGSPTENLVSQYLDYWLALFRFDFGVSTAMFPLRVSEVIMQSLPWTLFLMATTTVLGWLFGTAIGIMVGWKPGGRFDMIATPVSTFLHSMPAFWVGLLMLWGFGMKLGWFPLTGSYDSDVPFQINNVWFLLSVVHHAVLPATCLVVLGAAGWMFSMRNIMVTTITEDYVQLARAKGLRPARIIFGYAARNAILPNVTGLAMAIGGLIGGSVLVENVFSYPGMGFLLQDAIVSKDYPLMQTILLMLTLLTILANLFADLTYGLLDPRTREG